MRRGMAEEFVLSDEELKALSSGLFEDAVEERQSIGKDMHLMMQEFTADRNAYRFTCVKRSEVPMMAFRIARAESQRFYGDSKEAIGIRSKYRLIRYYWFDLFNFYQAVLYAAVKGTMATLVKDFGGYMLAFRGGVEWRQAGIAGMGEMDEQQMSIANKLKRG